LQKFFAELSFKKATSFLDNSSFDSGSVRNLTSARPQRSLRPFIVLAMILGLIALTCLTYWWINRGYVTTDDAAIDGHIYTIAPQIDGRIVEVRVDDNQHVAKGQILVVLDQRSQLVALSRAQAGLAQAQAQVSQANAQMAQAAAQQDEAQAMLEEARRDYTRFIHVNPSATTQQQVDAATATIRSAQARFTAAQAAAQAAGAAVEAARAQVRNEMAMLADANLQLTYTVITAPASGHVAMKTVQLGNVVAPGTALLDVVGDDVWVTANYKETQLSRIRPGEIATIQVDAVPGILFNARVDSIQYGTGSVFSLLPAENATGNYIKIVQRVPVKLIFDDARVADQMLAPGMSVEPSIKVVP